MRKVPAEEKNYFKISAYLLHFSVYGGFLCWISDTNISKVINRVIIIASQWQLRETVLGSVGLVLRSPSPVWGYRSCSCHRL